MPLASKIRKDILTALDHHIIPNLAAKPLLQILAEPPFNREQFTYRIEQVKPLPNSQVDALQFFRQWDTESMTSVRCIHIGIIYRGSSHIRIGVTEKQAQAAAESGKDMPPGIVSLQASALAVECFPPDVPGYDYRIPLNTPIPPSSEELNLFIDDGFISVNLIKRQKQQLFSTHHLFINDSTLASMGKMYLEELRLRDQGEIAQQLLGVMLLRLKRHLEHIPSPLHHISPLFSSSPLAECQDPIQEKHLLLCAKVLNYAQINLNKKLNAQVLARQADMTPQHLNSIFRQTYGMTVMQYIHHLRMEVAKKMLCDNTERISDIATLVGFTNADSFSTAFRKYTDNTPREFRTAQRREK